MDTIQIVQSLRGCLPPPHIQVTSWKSESEGGSSNLQGVANSAGLGGVVGVVNTPIGAPMMGLGNGATLLGNLATNRIENLSN